MKIIIDKQGLALLPVGRAIIDRGIILADNGDPAYSYFGNEYQIPSGDMGLEEMQSISRYAFNVFAFELWYEIPDARLTEEVPEGVSWRSYIDGSDPDNPVEVIRKWEDLPANRTGTGVSMRYYQLANNGRYNAIDAQLILDAGISVFSTQEMSVRISEPEYYIGDPETDIPIKTITWIDQHWSEGQFYDIIDAYLQMKDVYAQDWDNATGEEREILVKWNQVGLNKSASIYPGLSEGQLAKELGRDYEFFIDQMTVAARKRFGRWWTWLNMSFTNAGRNKFFGASISGGDWDSDYKQLYIDSIYRQFELGKTNALVDFTDLVISSYVQGDGAGGGDFVWTFTARTIANSLMETLQDNKPPL